MNNSDIRKKDLKGAWISIAILLILFLMMIGVGYCQLPIGTQRNPVTTDASGNVVTTPITFTNAVSSTVTPTSGTHLARYQDITNAPIVSSAVTNITGDTSILVGGTVHVPTLTWSNANGYAELAGENLWTGTTNCFEGQVCVTNLTVSGTSEIPMAHFSASTTNTLVANGTNANTIAWTSLDNQYRFRTDVTQTKIYADVVGTFEINTSVIFKATTNENVSALLWFAVNGTNVPNSGTFITFPTATVGTVTNTSQVIAAPIIAYNNSTNDYLEVHWWSNDGSIQLPHTPAGAVPPRPASPAAIITIKKISGGVN